MLTIVNQGLRRCNVVKNP